MSNVPTKQWKFDNSTLDYSSKGIIKRQLYYRVFSATWNTADKGKQLVTVRENFVREDHTETQQLEELDRLRRLRHPNIVTLLKGLLSDACNVIVLEYPQSGFLEEYIERETCIPVPKVYRWSLDIAKAVQFLIRQNYIHLGIDLSNIIISDNDALKVFDLRLTVPYPATSSSGNSGAGKSCPLMDKAINGLATLMLQLLTCDKWDRCDGHSIPVPERCPDVLRRLIARCWLKEDSDSIGIDEIVDVLAREQTIGRFIEIVFPE